MNIKYLGDSQWQLYFCLGLRKVERVAIKLSYDNIQKAEEI